MKDLEMLAALEAELAHPETTEERQDEVRELIDSLHNKAQDWALEDFEMGALVAWAKSGGPWRAPLEERQPALEDAAVELLEPVAQALKVFPGRRCSLRTCRDLAESSRYCEPCTVWRANSRASGYNLAFEHGEGGF